MGLVQLVVNIFLSLGVLLLWQKFRKSPQEDPRLSRGLQILQNKIAILEDLSDRTDVQVKQISALMDQKGKEVQEKIILAERHIQIIKKSIDDSLEVAKIFQDKIPHQEIIERQKTLKYIKAARMAHDGKSADQIAAELDIPKGELDFIIRINRDGLMFSDEDLPEWARQEPAFEKNDDSTALKTLGDRFRDLKRPVNFIQEATAKAPGPVKPRLPVENPKESIFPSFTENNSEEKIPAVLQKLTETRVFQTAMKVLEGGDESKINLRSELKRPSAGGVRFQVPEAEIRPFEFRKIKATDNLG